MTADERTVTRVRLLARLCGALYFSDRRDRMAALSAEATEIAAELDDPQATALAAAARRRAYWGPENLEGAPGGFDAAAARRARSLRHRAHPPGPRVAGGGPAGARRPDRGGGADRRLHRRSRPAAPAPVPVERRGVGGDEGAARRPAGGGRAARRRRGRRRAFAPRASPRRSTTPSRCSHLRREQARMGELEDPVREALSTNPDRAAWRAGLALLLHETGRTEEARAEFEAAGPRSVRVDPARRGLDGGHGAGRRPGPRLRRRSSARRSSTSCSSRLPTPTSSSGSGRCAWARPAATWAAWPSPWAAGRRRWPTCAAPWRANASLQAVVELAHSRVDLAWALGPGAEAVELLEQAEAVAIERRLAAVARRAALLRERFV